MSNKSVIKIALIEPPADLIDYNDAFRFDIVYPPFWAVSLTTYIKKNSSDFDVKIIDGNIKSLTQIIEEIEDYSPDVAGLSPSYISYINTLIIARVLKKNGCKVILGGHHATGLAEKILMNRGFYSNDYCVDAIIQQEGEHAFLELIKGASYDQIYNLIYKTNSGVKFNDTADLDLDALPFPEWENTNLDAYASLNLKNNYQYMRSGRCFCINSRRGCGWREKSKGGCIFCSQMYKKLRIRNPANYINELEGLIEKYKPDLVWDTSDDFLDDENWFIEFYNLYKKYSPKPRFRIYTRVDRLDENILKKLKELNIRQLILGVENNNTKLLGSMKKGVSSRANYDSLNLIQKYELNPICNFVIGAPGESAETLNNLLSFVDQLSKTGIKNIVTHTLKPLPNSTAFGMLLNSTGKKYIDNDIFDRKEVFQDWVRSYCRTTTTNILSVFSKMADNPLVSIVRLPKRYP